MSRLLILPPERFVSNFPLPSPPLTREREKCFYLKHAKTASEMCQKRAAAKPSEGAAMNDNHEIMMTFEDFMDRGRFSLKPAENASSSFHWPSAFVAFESVHKTLIVLCFLISSAVKRQGQGGIWMSDELRKRKLRWSRLLSAVLSGWLRRQFVMILD